MQQHLGNYQVIEKIGAGGFSEVFKGYDPFIKRHVAIKTCQAQDAETRHRFFKEAEIAGKLDHKNVTTVYDFGIHEGIPYLIQEYLTGEDLHHKVQRRDVIPYPIKLSYLVQIARGQAHAHSKGVIHRDIKPGNIRILEDGTAKIMDFGIAKLAQQESSLTRTGMTVGTAAYLAPEQIRGEPVSLKTDIFSFGVLAYELLTYERPFPGQHISTVLYQTLNTEPKAITAYWPQAPDDIVAVVERCLQKTPDDRFADGSELLAALEAIYDQAMAQPERTPHPAEEPTAERTALLGAQDLVVGHRDPSSLRPLPQTRPPQARPWQQHLPQAWQTLRSRFRPVRGEGESQPWLHAALQSLRATFRARPASVTTESSNLEAEVESAVLSAPLALESPQPAQELSPWVSPRQAKIEDAVHSIESLIGNHELIQAAEAMAFAQQIMGPFSELRGLQHHLALIARTEMTRLRHDGQLTAEHILDALIFLDGEGRLAPELARPWIERLLDFDPHNLQVDGLKAKLQARVASAPGPAGLAGRSRKQAEAIAAIENLLAAGDPVMAERALRFAIELWGEFSEIRELKLRIADVLQQRSS